MATLLIIVLVSSTLIIGALWGAFLPFPPRLEGFVVAVAGGALIVSIMLELIEPALDLAATWHVMIAVLGGAAAFSILDQISEHRFASIAGIGLLIATTLDGIPESLALGVALIDASPLAIAAFAGSILLSNIPEAAGGASQMVHSGISRRRVIAIWTLTTITLTIAALVDYASLESAPDPVIGLLQSFAAGAIIASLAIEVFPTAYRDDSYLAGFATAIGVVLAVLLDQL